MKMNKKLKIAIVYDWFDKWGGVERLLICLSEIFPWAEFFTSVYDRKKAFWAKSLTVTTSFIEKMPKIIKSNRVISLIFYPYAFESFDFSKFDLVISVSSSFAKGVITKPSTFHLGIILTPTRFLWLYPECYGIKGWRYELVKRYFDYLKKWDWVAAQRPDIMVSISKTVAKRVEELYKRKSKLIYPPFDFSYWDKVDKKLKDYPKIHDLFSSWFEQIKDKKKYFLVVSRLEPYKRVDLVIETFNRLDKLQRLDTSLIIVGDGSEFINLKRIVKIKKILFLKNLTDLQLAYLYRNAEALIMPQEEDFGYTSLEAQFFGCPIIAFAKGGAQETIIENKTGIFFFKQNISDLIHALERFNTISYNLKNKTKEFGRKHLTKFEKENFKKKILKEINNLNIIKK